MSSLLRRLFSTGSCCRCFACKFSLGSGLSLLQCPSCHSLQPAPPVSPSSRCCPDYFRLFALPAAFDLNPSSLRSSFLRLQGRVHPDRNEAVDGAWSAWINRANETLKNPLSRAIYLIDRLENAESEVSNESSNEEEAIDSFTSTTTATATTIAHVLEVREQLDSTDDPFEIAQLKSENDSRIAGIIGRLKRALDEEKDTSAAKKLVNELRYLQSIDQAIKERL